MAVSPEQSIVTKEARDAYASVGIATLYFTDNIFQTLFE
jgi:hypothetical protein